jgi:phosphatidylglycerol lysyltransferase
MLGVAGLLWASRGAFGRRGRILEQRLNPRWVLAIAVLVLAVAWVGLLSHRHVEYSNDLWWTFAFDAHAPRMLRATFTVAVLAAAFVGLNLLSPTAPAAGETLETAGERVRAALAHAVSADALLALSADKRFLFHPEDDAFVMYQVSGRSWVALGDPVGPPQRIAELVWSFRELCDRYGGWSVFYQVPAASLPVYVDAGLALLKLGEEARVPLAEFGLEGPARAELRQSQRRAQREGAVFEVVPAPPSAALIGELRTVSDEWLAGKSVAEKGFSVGYFDERYLEQLPIAVVRRDGRVVAFANVLATENREELSIDLMRFSSGAPKGAMDFLFIELMLWGRERGYRWFNLGMAPLAGLEQRPLAPAWHRLAGLVYTYGEHFYNFEGLRHYKQKFRPVWTPKYLATPGGLALPRVVLDVARLIAGGLPEIVRR